MSGNRDEVHDRGVQYAGHKYRKLIKKASLTQSMSRKGECLDNAPMESFFASLKKELVHRKKFRTRAQAKAAIFEWRLQLRVYLTRISNSDKLPQWNIL